MNNALSVTASLPVQGLKGYKYEKHAIAGFANMKVVYLRLVIFLSYGDRRNIDDDD